LKQYGRLHKGTSIPSSPFCVLPIVVDHDRPLLNSSSEERIDRPTRSLRVPRCSGRPSDRSRPFARVHRALVLTPNRNGTLALWQTGSDYSQRRFTTSSEIERDRTSLRITIGEGMRAVRLTIAILIVSPIFVLALGESRLSRQRDSRRRTGASNSPEGSTANQQRPTLYNGHAFT
jgi:hypothetical protein